MRRLLLLRHAKAERPQPGEDDHDRLLADRGRADAPRIGAYLARHRFVPDHAIVSTASRTRETWDLIAAEFDKEPPVKFDSRMYNAPEQAIMHVIHDAPRDARTLLLVGHNPGLHELASRLVASGEVEPRQRLRESLPTSGLAVISFASDDWRGVHPHGGRLEHFVTPKSLHASTD